MEEGNDSRRQAQVYPSLLSKGREHIFHLDLFLLSDRMHSREVHREVEVDQNESKDREERIFRKELEEEL